MTNAKRTFIAWRAAREHPLLVVMSIVTAIAL
jgi:hypothetical protein